MLIIGLTGGIGSGKTTVSNLFADLGIQIIDTDLIARELVDSNTSTLKEIISTFGEAVLNLDGSLDRKKLAEIVFNDEKEKQQLENILHPKIRNEVSRIIRDCDSDKTRPHYIIVVIPLLFETGFRDLIDRVLVVISDEKTRINRVLARDKRSVDEIRSIIKNQATDKKRIDETDDIIKNNNDFNTLESQVLQLHNKYTALSKTEH
ncbi:MAG: dephospho-CoA kinase [Gammaproteobacteria bacterium]|nr:dephospho-CoA kinase [Gammaproteobacteria bacterium]